MNRVEKAKISDVPQIYQLVNFFANKDEMLARPLSEIYENMRDYFVLRESGQVIACAALHINWSDLAEIRSVAVAEANQRKKSGTMLVQSCLEEAKELGIATVFCLTYKPDFFQSCGFAEIDKMQLPRKVWVECYRCPKFPDCDEIALVYHLKTGG